MDTHAKRFRHLLEMWGLTQEELGHLCGLKRGTVGTIINGRTTPDADALGELLRNKPMLNPDWLLSGNGSVERDGRTLTTVFSGGAPRKAGAPQGEHDPSLLHEIDSLRQQLKQAATEKEALYHFVRELQSTNRTSQEQINALLAQVAGKPYHPAAPREDIEPSEPRNRIGLRFYDEPAPQPWGIVRHAAHSTVASS